MNLISRPRLGALLVGALLLAAPSPAQAATAVAGPGGFAAGWVTRVVVASQGEAVDFLNGDVAPHNFVADGVFLSRKDAKKTKWCSAFTSTTCPLFWSPTATTGETVAVEGLERLKAGQQYPFYCSLHPGMKGTLLIR